MNLNLVKNLQAFIGGKKEVQVEVIAPTQASVPVPAKPYQHMLPANSRTFQAGLSDRLTQDWVTSLTSLDWDVRSQLQVIRVRAREFCENNEYASRFIGQMQQNVIGSAGFQLDVQGRDFNGKLDKLGNEKIENAFKTWSKRGNCDVTGTMSFRKLQQVVLAMMIRDGECFIRKIRRASAPHGFVLQILEPELIPEMYNRIEAPDVVVRAGIAVNLEGKPLWYYVKPYDPRTDLFGGIVQTMTGLDKVPAEDMLHVFVRFTAVQTRGVSWFTPVLYKLRQLNGFVEAHLVAARIAAAQGFFITSDASVSEKFKGDATAPDGSQLIDFEPGTGRQLAPGLKIEEVKPNFPSTNYGEFVKSLIRGVAGGLGVSYNTLGNDMESVNYSSARVAAQEEREFYKNVQALLAEDFLELVYQEWLALALLKGVIQLPIQKIDKFSDHEWIGRRWQWTDIKGEATSNQIAVAEGFKSRSQICAEMGYKFENVIEQIAAENERAKELKVELGLTRKTETVSTSVQQDINDEVPQN